MKTNKYIIPNWYMIYINLRWSTCTLFSYFMRCGNLQLSRVAFLKLTFAPWRFKSIYEIESDNCCTRTTLVSQKIYFLDQYSCFWLTWTHHSTIPRRWSWLTSATTDIKQLIQYFCEATKWPFWSKCLHSSLPFIKKLQYIFLNCFCCKNVVNVGFKNPYFLNLFC